jgi:hypothetical protein
MIEDAHRDGKRFVVHAEEKLTAFVRTRKNHPAKHWRQMQ